MKQSANFSSRQKARVTAKLQASLYRARQRRLERLRSPQYWVPEGQTWFADFQTETGRAYINQGTYASLLALLSSQYASFTRSSEGLYLDSSGLFETFLPDEPRLGDRGLLVEPEVTNLVPYSDASPVTWSNVSATLTSASLTDEMGLFTGLTVTSNGATWHRAHGGFVEFSSGTTYTATFYYKEGSSGNCGITLFSSTPSVYVSAVGPAGALSLGSDVGTSGATILENESLASGVYRATIVFTLTATVTSQGMGIGPHTATAGEDIIVLGCQIAASDRLTSYIRTNGAPVTRPKDTLILFPEARTYDISVSFSDGTPDQVLSGENISGAGWEVPANLNALFIESIGGAL